MKGLVLFPFILVLFLIPQVFSQAEGTPDTNEASISYSMPGYQDVYMNETGTFTVKVTNSGTVRLNNIIMLIAGIPSESFSIEPVQIISLGPGESSDFIVIVYPQNLTLQSYTLGITLSADETYEVTSLVLNVKELSSDFEEPLEEEKFDDIKQKLSSIAYLFVGVIVASFTVIIIMLILFKAKRCPNCGSKIEREYEGKNYTSYRCTKCKYYSLKMKKTT